MPLLRLCDCASLSGWDHPNTPEQIAKVWFDNFKDPSPSLYEANSLIEEVEAVVAFALTNKTSKRKAYHIVRADEADLAAAGLSPNNARPGSTGVVAIDFRHWEISGNKDQLIALVERALQRVVAGEDRLRWIGVRLQEACWKRFLDMPADQVIEEARRRSRCLLQKHPFPATALDQLVAELQAHPPGIPPERARLHAWLEYEDRLRCNREGTREQDWEMAENRLRHLYLEQLLGFAPGAGPVL